MAFASATPSRGRRAQVPSASRWTEHNRAVAVCCAVVVIAFVYLLSLPHQVIGDGREYLCVAASWAENGRPYASALYLQECAQKIIPGDQRALSGYFPWMGVYEASHFWFLSLLAAPFWAISGNKLGGGATYPLLHFCVAIGVVLRVLSRLGPYRGSTVLALFAASPLIFWSDKAHSEFFICSALLLAFTEIAAGELLWAALWLSIASTQQSTIALPAVVVLGLGAYQNLSRWRERRLQLLVCGSLLAMGLSPLYYLWRIHEISYLDFSVDRTLISVHRMLSLLVDPDIGLLTAWPVGLVLLVMAGLAANKNRFLAACAIGFFVIEAAAVSMQPNWNAGGTINVSRYALYMIPPLVVAGTAAIGKRAAMVMVGLLAVYHFAWNAREFYPQRPQQYVTRTGLSQWLYTNHPSWYDPEPEVFFERAIMADGIDPQGMPPKVWAVSTDNCEKVLMIRQPVADATPCWDAAWEVLTGARKPTSLGYINRR